MWPIWIFLSSLAVSHALECYQCNSHTTEGCRSLDVNLIRPTPCGEPSTSCATILQVAPFGADSSANETSGERMLRTCMKVEPEEFAPGCIDRVGTKNVRQTYCLCTDDACNPAMSQWRATNPIVIVIVSCFFSSSIFGMF